ncbi:hypothetical protein QC764_0100590 [Podospora pseudoanserina]|uniref:Uncharacterized protein n=1 Tax=Podospora pseudoanserina TaxID=2609844 RepID=A0ABR0HVM9_9PEZI|nr:hypothetical protein QC764_0100590 [Podospora pseudoanserina]
MRGSEHLRSYLSAITFWSELRLVRDSGVGESGANEDAAIPALGGASAGARCHRLDSARANRSHLSQDKHPAFLHLRAAASAAVAAPLVFVIEKFCGILSPLSARQSQV